MGFIKEGNSFFEGVEKVRFGRRDESFVVRRVGGRFCFGYSTCKGIGVGNSGFVWGIFI